MNIFKRITVVLISLAFISGLNSCEKKNEDKPVSGKLEFSVAVSEDLLTLKSASDDSTGNDTIYYSTYQILISVEGVNGEEVLKDKLLPLYKFGDGFVSEEVELLTGEYFLTKLMVLNKYGNVIYASPLSGSPRAYLVNQPLPIYFSINSGDVTQLAPEVLPVDGYTPTDFGYASFMIQVVKTYQFYVSVQLGDSVSVPPTLNTTAELLIYSADGWSYFFSLVAEVNKLEVRRSDYYQVYVYKPGFTEVQLTIAASDLLATSYENPYIITIGSGPQNTLVLQPGPEDGKDAFLSDFESDENFGDYLYFESSYLSDTILTVMRSTRSMINFDINQLPKSATINNVTLTLHYDIPIPWPEDSSWFRYNKKCNCIAGGAILQQIIEPWEEYEATWNNQPQTTQIGEVYIYPFILNTNQIEFDVTTLFVPNPYTDNVPQPNYGFMIRLYEDETFPGFRFASSDYPEEYMRPKLTVYYSLPE